ncbi:MAG TPA: hypothetical protein VEV41_13275 [Terriglobales bacterium]|nr:hypothetical protein [Terriglobales bacterium]
MSVLAAKLILTPSLIATATLAARRWGPVVGGLIAGMPLTSGPVSVFLAMERGATFAAASAQAALLGLIAVVSFCVAYAKTAHRARWPASCVAGFVVYFAAVLILRKVSVGIYTSMLLVCGIIVAAMSSTCTTHKNTDDRAEPSSWDLPFRMIAATGIVLLITGIAERIGPTWSGLLSPFPVFASVMAVFSHRTAGPSAAIHVLRGVITGSLAFASFFVIVALMLRNQSMLATYSAGAFAALLISGMSLLRLFPANKRP